MKKKSPYYVLRSIINKKKYFNRYAKVVIHSGLGKASQFETKTHATIVAKHLKRNRYGQFKPLKVN